MHLLTLNFKLYSALLANFYPLVKITKKSYKKIKDVYPSLKNTILLQNWYSNDPSNKMSYLYHKMKNCTYFLRDTLPKIFLYRTLNLCWTKLFAWVCGCRIYNKHYIPAFFAVLIQMVALNFVVVLFKYFSRLRIPIWARVRDSLKIKVHIIYTGQLQSYKLYPQHFLE